MDKKDYKDTLNLPQTGFSMRANLKSLEPRITGDWQSRNIYGKLREFNKNNTKFILHDGPPYANGVIHTGHALNKILKDIVLKFKVMQGYDCPFICGWDCHGLPVEHQLFKKLNKTKHDVDVSQFRKQAKEFALDFVESQKKDFIRLGIFSDWDNPYLTVDREYEYWMLKLLEKLSSGGYVYRGLKPVNWCSGCETALAEAEVEYAEKESHSIYFLFPVKDDNGVFPSEGKEIHFLVWTTTPWTLISNVAVAVHPGYKYVLAGIKDKLVVLAKDLLPGLEAKLNSKARVFGEYNGRELEHIRLKHPFLGREPEVILADFVSRDEGSGCVHIAPGHGAEDFSLVKKYNLEVIMPVNEKGRFNEDYPDFTGKNIEQAGQAVIESLNKRQLLLGYEKIKHSYPHCWRCKKPIIFRATYQWFLNIDYKRLRDKLLGEAEKVKWIPSSGRERMRAMLETRPDWCLSRQRIWGVPIPAVKCGSCGNVILDPVVISKTADVFREKGADAWFSQGIEEFIPKGYTCGRCSGKEFSKEFDILDVWFESGASFLGVLQANPDLEFPADMYLEGSDQHRGWFQVSLIPAVATENRAPFKTILTHGFVVDGEGRKMSKSLGNTIPTQEIISRYGAEILRLWTAYSDYTEDIRISPQILKQLVEMYRKIRNTIKFILGNLYDFSPDKDIMNPEDLLEIDRFMLSYTDTVFKKVTDYYGEYDFHKVCQEIFNFCNLDLSSFYLDILKDRLYTYSPNSAERKSAQNILCYILEAVVKMIAPILSFTAEEAFSFYPEIPDKPSSVYLRGFNPGIIPGYKDKSLENRWSKIIALRKRVLKEIENKRADNLLGSSLEAEVLIDCPEQDYVFYKPYEQTLAEVFIVSRVRISRIKDGEEEIIVKKTKNSKCPRCWTYKEDLGKNTDFPELCGRCARALKGG